MSSMQEDIVCSLGKGIMERNIMKSLKKAFSDGVTVLIAVLKDLRLKKRIRDMVQDGERKVVVSDVRDDTNATNKEDHFRETLQEEMVEGTSYHRDDDVDDSQGEDLALPYDNKQKKAETLAQKQFSIDSVSTQFSLSGLSPGILPTKVRSKNDSMKQARSKPEAIQRKIGSCLLKKGNKRSRSSIRTNKGNQVLPNDDDVDDYRMTDLALNVDIFLK
ncbi:hypothetical protein Tco_1568636 [Tanacetum coccineum]